MIYVQPPPVDGGSWMSFGFGFAIGGWLDHQCDWHGHESACGAMTPAASGLVVSPGWAGTASGGGEPGTGGEQSPCGNQSFMPGIRGPGPGCRERAAQTVAGAHRW